MKLTRETVKRTCPAGLACYDFLVDVEERTEIKITIGMAQTLIENPDLRPVCVNQLMAIDHKVFNSYPKAGKRAPQKFFDIKMALHDADASAVSDITIQRAYLASMSKVEGLVINRHNLRIDIMTGDYRPDRKLPQALEIANRLKMIIDFNAGEIYREDELATSFFYTNDLIDLCRCIVKHAEKIYKETMQ